LKEKRFLFYLIPVIFIVYSNSLNSPFFFDDITNIVIRTSLHINSLTELFFSLNQIFFKNGELYRPLSNLSFAINWIISGGNTVSYHILNILIHVVSSFFLFKTIFCLFETPKLESVNLTDNDKYFIASFATLLWALNPIQVQAVTYIVQRMASLAGMFSIMSIFFYISFRQNKKKLNIIFAILFYIFAFFSKENAAILPLVFILIELCFFDLKIDRKVFIFILVNIIFIVFIAVIILDKNFFISIIEGYTKRPFSLYERVLTQSRILVFYLSQFFYPVISRLSLCHDISLSTSIFSPLTTFFSLLFWIVGLVMAFLSRRKYPLISFAFLFFFITHLVESSIIPLELLFEHRNYFPSMFLFVPFSYFFLKLIQVYKTKQTKYFLYSFVGIIIFLFGIGTYIRNYDWKSQEAFWQDNILKSDTLRAWHNFGYFVYGKSGERNKAIYAYEQALNKKNLERNTSTAQTYNNLASAYYASGELEKSKENWKKVLEFKVPHNEAYFNLALIEVDASNFENALRYIELAIQEAPFILYYNTKALINYHLNETEKSFKDFLVGLKKEAYRWEPWFYIGNWHTSENNIERGYWFLRNAIDKEKVNLLNLYIYLINNRIKANDYEGVDLYTSLLLKTNSLQSILKKLDSINKDKILYFPIEYDEIKKIVISRVID
jgi:tetratricopeptide (TPR) repeat protein